jgi:Neurotransmitter-gated ion-channel ligand binding domain/Neurotransmitter-gated ion-channel transmembrane region
MALCDHALTSTILRLVYLKFFQMGITTAICLILICWAPPEVNAETPVPVGEQNEMLRPPNHDGKPVAVSIAIHVINLADIDEVSERFNLMFYLLARWQDPRLAFSPRDPAERFHVFMPKQIWHPRLEFINELGSHSTGDASVRVSPNGNVLYMERANGEFSTRFRLRRFPFDRQALQVIIHPFIGQALGVMLTVDKARTWISGEESEYSSLAEWQMMGIKATDSQASFSKFGPIPEARFQIMVRRKYRYYIWKIFVPLLLMVMLSWSVYWIDPKDLGSQVQISVTTILTVIAFAFSISLSLPKVPYLTFIDAFFLDCLLFVFLTAVEMTTVHVSGRSQREELGLRIRRVSRVAVPAAFVLSNAMIALHYFR